MIMFEVRFWASDKYIGRRLLSRRLKVARTANRLVYGRRVFEFEAYHHVVPRVLAKVDPKGRGEGILVRIEAVETGGGDTNRPIARARDES